MLNNQQQKQVQRQIAAYEKRKGVDRIAIPIDQERFVIEIDPFVANPRMMNSGLQMVQYLLERPQLVYDKVVVDMGTGCGILGIVAGLLGAKKVLMMDVDQKAVANAKRNIQRLGLSAICEAFCSDLFKNYGDRPKADVLIFNHPFFAARALYGKPWTRMMLGGTTLIANFLAQAPRFSYEDSLYILLFMNMAGYRDSRIDNDPGKRSQAYGFEIVNITEQKAVKSGLQRTKFKIYELRHTGK